MKVRDGTVSFERLLAAHGGSADVKNAAALYGDSQKALLHAARNGRAIAIRDVKGALHFPVMQFGPDGGVLPGLEAALAILTPRTKVDSLTPVTFLLNKTARLGGLSPIDALRRGGEKRVTAVKQLAIEFLE